MPTTREIDRLAQNVFNDTLPPTWLIRKQDPDVHIDYFTEISDDNDPSGIVFGVQLKGTASPKYTDNSIKMTIKTKHLKYYLDKVKQPIFLIAVDVKKKKGYWIFLQEWAKEHLKTKNWRQQRTINIKIPLTNLLTDHQKLSNAISMAEIYMRELWPSSISAAANHEKKSLEAIDNRFQVEISYDAGITKYTLQSKELLNIDIQLRDASHIQSKYYELLNTGGPATFYPSEIVRIEGSPLFDKVFQKMELNNIIMESTKKVQASLLLFILDKHGQEKTALYGIDGIIRIGEQKARFVGGLNGSPFKLELTFPFPVISGENPLNFSLLFNCSVWNDTPVLHLPYYEKLKKFFLSIEEEDKLRLVCELNGNHFFTSTSRIKVIWEFINDIINHLQLVDKIRVIGRQTEINPLYPKDGIISTNELETIFLLYYLISFGKYRGSGLGVNFKMESIIDDNLYKMLQAEGFKRPSSPLVIEPKDQKFLLLGKEFEFGLLRYTLTNPVLVTDISRINWEKGKTYEERVEVEWSGGNDSELIITSVTD